MKLGSGGMFENIVATNDKIKVKLFWRGQETIMFSGFRPIYYQMVQRDCLWCSYYGLKGKTL